MRRKEKLFEIIFLIVACISIVAVACICVFLFANGIPAMKEIGFGKFLGGTTWKPGNDMYGIFPMIVGSLYITGGAIVLGVPVGIFAAVFLARYCPKGIYKVVKPATDLLAGIPSVVYGFFGLIVVVPLLQDVFGLPVGESGLAGALVLAIMALPTIITVSQDAMLNCPRSQREASLALGASRWQTIYKVVMPYSISGITSAIVLGIGRAFGETMAVLMVTGNAAVIPLSITDPLRTIPATIAAELGEAPAGGPHYQSLFLLGVVLFFITLIINSSVEYISAKNKK